MPRGGQRSVCSHCPWLARTGHNSGALVWVVLHKLKLDLRASTCRASRKPVKGIYTVKPMLLSSLGAGRAVQGWQERVKPTEQQSKPLQHQPEPQLSSSQLVPSPEPSNMLPWTSSMSPADAPAGARGSG